MARPEGPLQSLQPADQQQTRGSSAHSAAEAVQDGGGDRDAPAPAAAAGGQQEGRRYRGRIAKLSKIVYKRNRTIAQLHREKQQLLIREGVLMRALAQQEGMAQTLGSIALLDDAPAQQVLLSAALTGSRTLPDSQQLYTIQRLRCATTPARVAEIRAADVKRSIIPHLRDITMRLSLQLQHQKVQGQLSASLSDSVDEYQELLLLLHTAADNKLLQLGTLNFDTLQGVVPPEGVAPPTHFWEAMTDSLQLTAEQTDEIAAGFHVYAKRRAALSADMQQLLQELQALLLSPSAWWWQPSQAPAAAGETTAAAAPRRAAQRAAACQHKRPSSISKHGQPPSEAGSAAPETNPPAHGSGRCGATAVLEQLLANRLLDNSHRAQQLLVELGRLNRAIRESDRMVAFQTANTLTKTQLACCIVHSYPFICQPCAWAEVVFRRSQLYHMLHPQGQAGQARKH